MATARERSYLETMAAHDLADQARIIPMSYHNTVRHEQMLAFLAPGSRPAAVFCWSDLFAVELLGLARSSGIKVPEEFAIIGYDNSPPAAMPLMGLTSVDQDARGLGEAAATALLSRMAGRNVAKHLLLAPSLAVRTSHSSFGAESHDLKG